MLIKRYSIFLHSFFTIKAVRHFSFLHAAAAFFSVVRRRPHYLVPACGCAYTSLHRFWMNEKIVGFLCRFPASFAPPFLVFSTTCLAYIFNTPLPGQFFAASASYFLRSFFAIIAAKNPILLLCYVFWGLSLPWSWFDNDEMTKNGMEKMICQHKKFLLFGCVFVFAFCGLIQCNRERNVNGFYIEC